LDRAGLNTRCATDLAVASQPMNVFDFTSNLLDTNRFPLQQNCSAAMMAKFPGRRLCHSAWIRIHSGRDAGS
jgi:hypothetical protein